MLGKEAVGEQANYIPAADPILPRHYSQFHATIFPSPLRSVAADGLAAGATTGLRGLFCCFVPWKEDSSGTAKGPHCPLLLLQAPSAPHTFLIVFAESWCEGRWAGEGRVGTELHPGHSWASARARQPVPASCCCCNAWAVLVPPVLGLH